jgi:hypothetical protein
MGLVGLGVLSKMYSRRSDILIAFNTVNSLSPVGTLDAPFCHTQPLSISTGLYTSHWSSRFTRRRAWRVVRCRRWKQTYAFVKWRSGRGLHGGFGEVNDPDAPWEQPFRGSLQRTQRAEAQGREGHRRVTGDPYAGRRGSPNWSVKRCQSAKDTMMHSFISPRADTDKRFAKPRHLKLSSSTIVRFVAGHWKLMWWSKYESNWSEQVFSVRIGIID